MKLSVIIPLYNKEKYIERCIKSLVAQDMDPDEYEILIIDDGSTDSGKSIAQHIATEYENIRLKCQENSGPGAARNNGISEAKGEYLYFLDADDFVSSNVFKILLDYCLENDLEILEFSSRVIEEGSTTGLTDAPAEIIQKPGDPSMDGISYISKHDFRNEVWRYFIRKSFLLDTGIKFSEDMKAYEDLIFTANTFLRVNRITKVNLDVHRHVMVPGSIVRSKSPETNMEFIQGMVKAVERLDVLIKSLNRSHEKYPKAVKKVKAKQQAVVFALIIRAFKYRLHSWKDLKSILAKMKKLEAYPIDPRIGGIADGNIFYNRIMVPIFNSGIFLFLGISIVRLIPRN